MSKKSVELSSDSTSHKRRGSFFNTQHEFCHEYDLIMVLPYNLEDDKVKESNSKIMESIKRSGLEVFSYLSVQKDELIVMIKLPDKKMRAYADLIDFRMPLSPAVAKEMMEAGNPEEGIAPVFINDSPTYSPLAPYDCIYGKFENDFRFDLYKIEDGENSPFTVNMRNKLLFYILQAKASEGGAYLKIDKLIVKKNILAVYPCHDKKIAAELLDAWHAWSGFPWNQPFQKIRDYFGEKIGLYFQFMGHYSYYLILPALIGLAFQLVVWGTWNFSHPVLPFFSVLISAWAIFMLEGWKRNEKMIALKWGTCGFEKEEPERPEFKGDLIKSYINGEDMLYFPPETKSRILAGSGAVIFAMMCLVVGTVSSIYVLRFQLYQDIGSNASIVASALNSIQITAYNIVYGNLATRLTKVENHRTATEYEDSMIGKLFCFQFVNSYVSFYYLAFIAPFMSRPSFLDDDGPQADFVGDCGYDDCMIPLSINLAIIFCMNLTVNNVVEVILPYITYKRKLAAETEGTTETLTQPEKEYMLSPYDVMTSSIKDYAEIAVQYGYMTIFIVCLPIGVLMSLINNVAEVKLDGWKMLTMHQRPIPKAAEDIGQWQTVFTTISVIAVITNGALICFTMQVLDGWTLANRIWIFIGYCAALIFLQYVISAVIDDEPPEYVIQLERNDFITSKIIDKVADEQEEVEEEVKSAGEIVISQYPRDWKAGVFPSLSSDKLDIGEIKVSTDNEKLI